MGAVRRGCRNAFRNPTRTVAIVLVVAATFALSLAMLIAHQATNERVSNVTANLDDTVTVTPADYFGGFGGGSPLTSANVATVAATPHVVAVASSVMDRLRNENSTAPSFGPPGSSSKGDESTTSLTSPITAGSLGNRFGGFGGSPSISVIGTSTPLSTTLLGASTVTLVKGTAIDGAASTYVADVGQALATKNSLSVGSTFTAYEKTFTVDGIFSSSSTFSNAALVVPLKTVEALSGIDGVTNVVATVDQLGNVQSTATAIQSRLGSNVANVTAGQPGSASAASELSSIKTITLYSLVGALIAAAAILLMSMLMIVRDRRREIGTLKAFGSSNGGIVATFTSEALTLTFMSAIVGTVVGVVLSNPLLTLLENNTSSSPGSGRGGFGGGPGFARFASNAGGPGFGAISRLHEAIGTNVALFAVLIAVGIALLGSAVPAYVIAKVRPAEVMRSES